MKKRYGKYALIVMFVLFIGGIILLIAATRLGIREATITNRTASGMTQEQYYSVADSMTRNCQIAGSIVSIVSAIGLLLSGYVLLKEIK